MKTIEYKFIDKSTWPRGEWDDEPDKIQFVDPDTNLPCLIVRTVMGFLCGYVGIDKTHPYFKKNFDDIENISVHGGVSFSRKCDGTEHGICHKVEYGEEDDDIWWIGFDTAHFGDVIPKMTGLILSEKYGETYKNIAYLKKEIKSLARQLVEIKEKGTHGI